MVRLRFTLLCAALLGACAAQADDATIEITFDPCEPIAVLTPPDATEMATVGIDGALAMWTALRDWPIARASPDGDELGAAAIIQVVFQDAAHPFHGLYDDQHGVVYINTDLIDDHQRSVTIAHELGHAFGLFHIESRPSVMNPGNVSLAPSEEDAAEIDALWGSCPGG